MKSILLSALLIILLSACGDDDNPTEPTEKADPVVKGTIKGFVYDAISELPISGVRVSTFPITSSTRTDENGEFELLEVSPDLYDLHIIHKDYFAYTSKIKVSDKLTNDIELFITSIESQNNKPDKPTLLYPVDEANIGFDNVMLKWECNDIDNDSLKYDVFFKQVGSEFQLIGNNITSKSLVHQYDTNVTHQYEWYVVAKDNYTFSISDTFSFNYKETIIMDIPNMIGNWKFDGNITDYGPNTYAGSNQNVFFVTDRKNNFEYAATFQGKPGSNSKILLPSSLQLSTQFTISMWIKPMASLGENGSVGYFECISKWGGSGAGKASWAFGITKESSLFLGTYKSNATIKATTNIFVNKEIWQHVAVTFDSGTATFYIDGVNVFTASGMNIPQESSYSVSIGGRQDQLSSYHGAMDDLYIFDRALSVQEILQLSTE
jgi:hypothetical protein